MKKYFRQLQQNLLFKNFDLNSLESVLNCLAAKSNYYKKQEIILLQGGKINFIGIVLKGKVRILKEDYEGNINLFVVLGINDIFGESFACADIGESPVTIEADDDCEILFIDCKRIIKVCNNACVFHSNLIENLLIMIAKKNIVLSEKIEALSKRTIREKLLTFFYMQMQITHSKKFSIPYNREGLANYLCVDRSALSRELSNMRDDGIIKFKKNEIQIL